MRAPLWTEANLYSAHGGSAPPMALLRTGLVTFFLALVALAPLAAAQLPGAPAPCGPLTAQVAVPQALGPGESGDVRLTVANAGNFAAAVTVAASLPDPASGWAIVNPEDQQQTVAASGSQEFVFSVQPSEGASQTATINFTASGACSPPVGACPQGACDAQPVTATGQLQYRAPEGLRIPGLDSLGFPVEYLVAGIVLIGITTAIPFLLRGKKRGISAECPEPLKLVRPGRGASFPIELRNATPQPATAHLEVGPVPEGWSAFMPLPEVQLAAREKRSLWLMVRAPPQARAGETVDIELRLRHAAGNRKGAAATVRVRAEVNPNVTEPAAAPAGA